MNNAFNIKDIVYLKLDKDQNPMYVVSIWIKETGVSYECRNHLGNCTYYGAFELTLEQNILTKIK